MSSAVGRWAEMGLHKSGPRTLHWWLSGFSATLRQLEAKRSSETWHLSFLMLLLSLFPRTIHKKSNDTLNVMSSSYLKHEKTPPRMGYSVVGIQKSVISIKKKTKTENETQWRLCDEHFTSWDLEVTYEGHPLDLHLLNNTLKEGKNKWCCTLFLNRTK